MSLDKFIHFHYNKKPFLFFFFLSFFSGKDGRQVLKVNHAGAKFGLNLKLNIQQFDYFRSWTSQAGLKVLIHHHDTPPTVEELGFSLAPGTSTLAAIRKEKVRVPKTSFQSSQKRKVNSKRKDISIS